MGHRPAAYVHALILPVSSKSISGGQPVGGGQCPAGQRAAAVAFIIYRGGGGDRTPCPRCVMGAREAPGPPPPSGRLGNYTQ